LFALFRAEALKLTGALENIPSLSDEQKDMVTMVKGKVLRTTEDFRVQVRRRLSKEGLESFFENEKMAALGLTGGAVLGTLL